MLSFADDVARDNRYDRAAHCAAKATHFSGAAFAVRLVPSLTGVLPRLVGDVRVVALQALMQVR